MPRALTETARAAIMSMDVLPADDGGHAWALSRTGEVIHYYPDTDTEIENHDCEACEEMRRQVAEVVDRANAAHVRNEGDDRSWIEMRKEARDE